MGKTMRKVPPTNQIGDSLLKKENSFSGSGFSSAISIFRKLQLCVNWTAILDNDCYETVADYDIGICMK